MRNHRKRQDVRTQRQLFPAQNPQSLQAKYSEENFDY